MQHMGVLPNDGEVLVIEVDGKRPPTATEQELSKRRGNVNMRRGALAVASGIEARRSERPGGARNAGKGDKSKNGKEVMVVVMYTLRRDPDGKLHGPINKKIWATFGGRRQRLCGAGGGNQARLSVRTRPRRYRLCWMVPRG